METADYYVSAANGDDNNDGTPEEQAWATIDHAASQVLAGGGADKIVAVARGIYRETIVVDESGTEDSVVRFVADPLCLYFANENPGRVRLTVANESEDENLTDIPLTLSGRQYVEFHGFNIDGGLRGVYSSGVQTGTRLVDSIIRGKTDAVRYVDTVRSYLRASQSYCAWGGLHRFSSGKAPFGFRNAVSYRSVSEGYYGWWGGSAYSCLALNCSGHGFSDLDVADHCFASMCATSDVSCTVVTECHSWLSGTRNDFAVGNVALFPLELLADVYLPWLTIVGAGGLARAGDNTIPGLLPTDVDLSRHVLALRADSMDIGVRSIAEPPDYPGGGLNWSVCKHVPPSREMAYAGDYSVIIPAQAGLQVTVKVWVFHEAITGDKPQIVLRGESIDEQVAEHTVSSGAWQELSVGAVPSIDERLVLLFRARHTGGGSCYFSDLDVQVSAP